MPGHALRDYYRTVPRGFTLDAGNDHIGISRVPFPRRRNVVEIVFSSQLDREFAANLVRPPCSLSQVREYPATRRAGTPAMRAYVTAGIRADRAEMKGNGAHASTPAAS
jgi:hypothetical protein